VAVSALDAAYAGITRVVGDLDDHDLLLPSGCHGWSIADLLLHVTLDAQRALITFATPADGPPDVDAVTYWRDFPGDKSSLPAAVEHAAWVRRAAAAYARPSGVVEVWRSFAPAAVRAAAMADPHGHVATQGHVLTCADFTATLVTEAVIHHLDMITALPDATPPAPRAVAITLTTLEGLAPPGGLPSHWSEREKLLKSTGRAPLTAEEQAAGYPILS
jgi:uncharacterized protein (TIGR03083 family)